MIFRLLEEWYKFKSIDSSDVHVCVTFLRNVKKTVDFTYVLTPSLTRVVKGKALHSNDFLICWPVNAINFLQENITIDDKGLRF